MKMYVVGYKQREESAPRVDPQKPWEDVDVQFSLQRGDWLIDSQELAQRELEILTSMRVHVGAHYCLFELEEEAGTFAIVCRNH